MTGLPYGGPEAGVRAPRRGRSLVAIGLEKLIELIIRTSGFSAIFFVLAIFFFVFREAAPMLFEESFKLGEFLFSTKWYPTSEVNVRYGTLALTVGSRNALVQ